MAMERTFSMIKPDAVAKNVIGEIYARFEKAGLRIVASRMVHLKITGKQSIVEDWRIRVGALHERPKVTSMSNQPQRRGRPVVEPNSLPRLASPSPIASNSSVGNGPDPTRVA